MVGARSSSFVDVFADKRSSMASGQIDATYSSALRYAHMPAQARLNADD
jgi:hypothetical protein